VERAEGVHPTTSVIFFSAQGNFNLIIFKPSNERVRTCKDYVIDREITTLLKIAASHASCDAYSPKAAEQYTDHATRDIVFFVVRGRLSDIFFWF